MNKPREYLPRPFREAMEIKKLEDTQNAIIARRMNMLTHLSEQRTASLSSSVGSSYKSATETSVTDVGKIKPCGYLTLLDVSALYGLPSLSSSVLPDTEFVPNSFHQNFHVSRWKLFVKTTPKWILEMGMEGLYRRQQDRNGKTQKGSDKENSSVTDTSGSRLLQEKRGNENSVCDSNVAECTVENPEMERELGREKHGISERENGTSACTEEWRDWSLQLTGQGSLIITGKADKNVINRSRDVSSCQRVNARTLRLTDGTVYKLVGMPDHFTNLPCYIRNKFQCGFPVDWKEVKLAWEKYEEQDVTCFCELKEKFSITLFKYGSPCSFSWLQAHLPECSSSSTVQKDKTVQKTSSPVEESKSGESPPATLNSVVRSVCCDKSRVASVDRVGEAQSRLTVEQELGKELDAEETGACNQTLKSLILHKSTEQSVDRVGEARSRLTVEQELGKELDAEETGVCNRTLNSTVAQKCGKKTVVERRDGACMVNPSSVTSQGGIKKSHLKDLEVRLKRLSSCLIEKYIQQSNCTEMDVNSECSGDDAVSLVEQSGTVPVRNIASEVQPANTDRLSSCDTSKLTRAPVNTALGAGDGNTLMNPYILCRWTPVLVARSKLKFVGYLESTGSPDILHTTDVIQCRKDFDRVKCHDGTFYKLQGSCADPQNTIPSPIQKQLHGGLPHLWRKMIERWVDLLAVFDGQLEECELGQENMEARACAASTVERTDCADRSAGCDELVDETVQPTATVTGRNEREATELSTASDENDSIDEAAVRNPMYGKGSLIPLRNFEVQGIIKKSSRGRVVFPPVRYWLGERLVQQHNQPAFFCRQVGVQKVIVNQRVDSVPLRKAGKKRKCSEYESDKLSVSKRKCNKGETEFHAPREKHRAVSHGTWSGRDLKVHAQAIKGRRAPEVGTNIKNHSRLMPKKKGCCSRIPESVDSLPDDISIQAREGSRILIGKSQMERMVPSKPVSSGHSLNSAVNRREKCLLGAQKRQGLENYKGGTSKQRGYVSPPFDLLDSEDELEADDPTDASVHNRAAYNPLSVRSVAPSSWQHLRWKEMDRLVNRQQIMESNSNKSLLEPTTGSKADQFGNADAPINPVRMVQFDDAVSLTTSFDEEDISTSYISTACSLK